MLFTLIGLAGCKEASCPISSSFCGDGGRLGAAPPFAGGEWLSAIRNKNTKRMYLQNHWKLRKVLKCSAH